MYNEIYQPYLPRMEMIVAHDETGGIGRCGTIPWGRDPVDMAWFAHYTKDRTVIMGSNTYFDPMFPKPLKNRTCVVITTRKENYVDQPGVVFTPRLDWDFLCRGFYRPILIGGASLYNQAIEAGVIDQIVATRIEGDYNCDTRLNMTLINEKYRSIPVNKNVKVKGEYKLIRITYYEQN